MSPRLSALPLILAGIAAAQPAAAQTPYSTVPQPQSDADALGAAMRTLASNPQNVDALITAGELSLRGGDASGAAALFARADKVDPRNGRVKAGMASILVHEERPGEALRYFNMAEGYGLLPARFAAERGLAYDLIGEPERAQRDYRVALASGANDEVVRRYGLSLGIAGKQDAALAQLDTLIRKGDRGAWRARAFVLAMNGDVAGANKIATTMMPPGMAQGLGPFFQRLPTLSAADRAFAVHYGETRPTPERLADARMTPPLPPLAPEAGAPTMVAAAQPARSVTPTVAEERTSRRDRRNRRDRTETAAVAPPVTATASPLPSPPVYAVATVQPLPGASTGTTAAAAPLSLAQRPAIVTNTSARPLATPAPTQLAQATPPANALTMLSGRSTQPIPFAATRSAVAPAITARSTTTVAPASGTAAPSAVAPSTVRLASSAASTAAPAGSAASGVRTKTPPIVPVHRTTPGIAANVATPAGPATGTSAAPSTVAPSLPVLAASRPAAAPTIASAGLASPGFTPSPVTPAPRAVVPTAAVPAIVTPAPARVAAVSGPATAVPSRATGGSALASIIAGISVPASELAVAPAATPLVPRATRAAVTRAATGTRTAAAAPVRKSAGEAAIEDEATPVVERRRGKAVTAVDEDAKATTDRRKRRAADEDVADRKATKLTPAEKRAADKKALADKAAADERKAAKSEPERIWVQVAGGANPDDLSKAWRAQQSKAAALKGRAAYATPLRATNRVVTGPFKTDAEARAFVNQLAKQGVSAFPFTSDKGQKMTKLPTK